MDQHQHNSTSNHSDDKLDLSSITISGDYDDLPNFRGAPHHLGGLNMGMGGMMDQHDIGGMVPTFSTFSTGEVYRSIESSEFHDYGYEADRSLSEFGARDGFRAAGPKHNHLNDDSDYLGAVGQHRRNPEPPEPPGGYLEPAYHFMTSSRPSTVFQTLVGYFHVNGIDSVVKQDKYKIKCVAYKNGGGGARCPFIVRVWSTDASSSSSSSSSSYDKQYAVEFQRRSGDIMQFSEIYRTCKSYLEQEGYTAITSSKHSIQLQTPPPLDVQVTVDQARDTMKCLVQMAGSDCADVKAKAIEALTDMTRDQDEKIANMLITDGGLDMLVDCLDSSYEDVHRAAIAGIANLTKQRAAACKAVLASDQLPSLYKLANSETAQIVRETARALENIGTTMGKGAIDFQFRRTLDILSYSKDPSAQQYASRLVQTLGI